MAAKIKSSSKAKVKTKAAASSKSATKKKPAPALKAAAKPKAAVVAKVKVAKPVAVAPKFAAKPFRDPEIDRRSKAEEAVKTALAASKKMKEPPTVQDSDEEFDAEAFFAASGGQGLFKAHVMRKERVDVNIDIRFRVMEKGPFVHHAELINLSKTGLCLKTKDTYKNKTILRIEIPLPHTAELFSIQAEVIWSQKMKGPEFGNAVHTGMMFMPMNQAKQAVINNFIQQRRDEIIMAKIGLDKFTDSVPVAGLD